MSETEAYLKSLGIVWNRYQIAEAYMIMGGTPYYLQKLQKQYSLSQNVDNLFFSENAELRDEYGLKENAYSGMIQSQVKLDDLFG